MISFLMMAKNVRPYIGAAMQSLQSESSVAWELIVVDDGSEDGTRQIAEKFAREDSRIRVFANPYDGKVMGTNFAYTHANGSFIKCIDSDDVLNPRFFRVFEDAPLHDVMFHSTAIVDEELIPITTYCPNSRWLNGSYLEVLQALISLPKFSWSFSRELGDKVFPLPASLPFEDVWMSLLIKRHALRPIYVPEPLYLYRQHNTQTFGGILNYSRPAVAFRANRLLRLIDILEAEERIINSMHGDIFASARAENQFLTGTRNISQLIGDDRLRWRIPRLLMMRFSPQLASLFARLRWKMEAAREIIGGAGR